MPRITEQGLKEQIYTTKQTCNVNIEYKKTGSRWRIVVENREKHRRTIIGLDRLTTREAYLVLAGIKAGIKEEREKRKDRP